MRPPTFGSKRVASPKAGSRPLSGKVPESDVAHSARQVPMISVLLR